MSDLPKLRVTLPFAHIDEEVYDLEQFKHHFNQGNEAYLITVEDQLVNSYEELVLIATRNCYKDKELYCRTDCQASNCQSAAQIMACWTFQERNPCITNCQKYKERTGWLNRILE